MWLQIWLSFLYSLQFRNSLLSNEAKITQTRKVMSSIHTHTLTYIHQGAHLPVHRAQTAPTPSFSDEAMSDKVNGWGLAQPPPLLRSSFHVAFWVVPPPQLHPLHARLLSFSSRRGPQGDVIPLVPHPWCRRWWALLLDGSPSALFLYQSSPTLGCQSPLLLPAGPSGWKRCCEPPGHHLQRRRGDHRPGDLPVRRLGRASEQAGMSRRVWMENPACPFASCHGTQDSQSTINTRKKKFHL